jgi:penicillin-binding protein 1C
VGTRRRLTLLVLLSAVVAFGAWRLARPPLLAGQSFSQAVYDRDGRLLRLTLAADEQYRLALPLARLSPQLIEATLLQEDQYFYWHPGVNPVALLRAALRTYVQGDRRVGASTISMQLARILNGIQSRTLGGKLEQISRALWLELRYSKKEILEAYLNRVSYGGNIQGAAAASLVYFGREPTKLTLAEALTLSVIPQHPARRRPGSSGPDADTTALLAARQALFERWLERYPEHPGEQSALALPFRARSPADLPFHAPHLVEAVLRDHPREPEIHTTLDPVLQKILERQTHQFVERRARVGIRNAAALLVDSRDMAVKAALGSVNYFDDDIQGQVNGVRARRSPGSALKPFIYALGIEQGVVHPLTMLKDAPASFGGYNPENFDREFVGPIKAGEALIKSRNLPAVYVATRLQQPTLYQFLRDAGIGQMREESHYGLALVLGGAEVSMEELAKLYAMLANGGVLRPLRYLQAEPATEGTRTLGEESAFLVLDILEHNPRPGQAFRSEWTRANRPVYWKTGTSFAFRDAWSIGIVGPYVLAVWVGNFDGEGNPAFVGIDAASPLMFDIIDAIHAQEPNLPPTVTRTPENLTRVEVCSLSGHLPGRHCHHTVPTWFIPGVSPIKTCEVHRAVTVNIRTGQRICRPGTTGTRTDVYEYWPSDLLKLFRQAGVPRRVPPAESPECPLDNRAMHGQPPQITSPQTGLVYPLRAKRIGKETIPLQAVTDADVHSVYWFIDEKFLGKTNSGQPFFWSAKPGTFMVRAVDDQGRADVHEIKVIVVN